MTGRRRPPVAKTLVDIGARLSNVAFNLSQAEGRPLTAHDCHTLRELVREWDAAPKSYRYKRRARGGER